MEDTDWRPSLCLACGEMIDAARNPICEREGCDMDKHRKTRMMKPKEDKQYVVIKDGHPVSIISHEELLEKSRHLSKCTRYFELGPEVEVQVSVSIKPKGAVYRGSYES